MSRWEPLHTNLWCSLNKCDCSVDGYLKWQCEKFLWGLYWCSSCAPGERLGFQCSLGDSRENEKVTLGSCWSTAQWLLTQQASIFIEGKKWQISLSFKAVCQFLLKGEEVALKNHWQLGAHQEGSQLVSHWVNHLRSTGICAMASAYAGCQKVPDAVCAIIASLGWHLCPTICSSSS